MLHCELINQIKERNLKLLSLNLYHKGRNELIEYGSKGSKVILS